MISIDKISKSIVEDLQAATIKIMNRAGVDSTSNLVKSLEWEYRDDTFYLLANDYFQALSSGRRIGVRHVPPEDLIPWMKRKGIHPSGSMTYSQLAYIISNAIYKNGIRGKYFSDPVLNTSTDFIAEVISTDIAVQIVNDVVESLESLNK
jgi:hypothetical protein